MKKEKTNSLTRRGFVGTTAKAITGFLIIPRFVMGGKSQSGVPFYRLVISSLWVLLV
jgi:hypothetical protein